MRLGVIRASAIAFAFAAVTLVGATYAGIKIATHGREVVRTANSVVHETPYQLRLDELIRKPDKDIRATDYDDLRELEGMACAPLPKDELRKSQIALAWDKWLTWWARMVGSTDADAMARVTASQHTLVSDEMPDSETARCNEAGRRTLIADRLANPIFPTTLTPYKPAVTAAQLRCALPMTDQDQAFCGAYEGAKEAAEEKGNGTDAGPP